jgi:hypothetical protein
MNKTQYKILKYGYKRSAPYLKVSEKLKISEDKLHLLLQGMQDFIIPDNESKSYSDSSKGEEIHENRQREDNKFRIPLVISVMALIKSFFPELASLWTLLMQQPK